MAIPASCYNPVCTLAIVLVAQLLTGCSGEETETQTQRTDYPRSSSTIRSSSDTLTATASDLRVDVFIPVDVVPGSNHGEVLVLSSDGSKKRLPIESPMPSLVILVPDGLGGFVWQLSEQDAGPPPIFKVDASGSATVLVPGDDEMFTLVGADYALPGVLVTRRRGTAPENMTTDLLSISREDGERAVVARDIGGWESVVTHAAAMQTILYARTSSTSDEAVVKPSADDAVTVFEGGEATGEYIQGIDIATQPVTGVVLVETAAGYPDHPTASLRLVDLTGGSVRKDVAVPLQLGVGDSWLVPRDVSAANGHVLINRFAEGTWFAPLVYDLNSGEWMMLKGVEGRAVLAHPPPDRR